MAGTARTAEEAVADVGASSPQALVGPSDAGAHRSRLSSVLVAGAAVGTFQVAASASFASLIWTGPLEVHLPSGVGLGLFGALTALVVVGQRATLPGTMGTIQDVPAAILATLVAALAVDLAPEAREALPTVVLAIAATAVTVGAFLWLLGRSRLGRLVRYLPYPVVGGFLGGTGVLLVAGSVRVITGSDLSLAALPGLLKPGITARWLPAVAFAVLLLLIARRGWPTVLIPVAFLATTAVFHVAVLASGTGIAGAQQAGWVLGPFAEGTLWRPWSVTGFGAADWVSIARQAPTMVTVALFTAMALLLNAGGVEMVHEADVDLDRDLRAAGVSNVIAGLGGGMPGYHSVSLSTLAHQMQADDRRVGLVAAGFCAVALVAGAGILALFPRFVIGGLVLFVGLSLLREWLVAAWHRLPAVEYVVLVGIVVVIAGWGFMAGVVLGLVAAVVLFLFAYSRVSVTKHAFTARHYRSNVDRPAADIEDLRHLGDRVQVLVLQGYLFFGTANALYERVRERVQDRTATRLRFLVLSFRHVSGLDSSAVQSLAKIRARADAAGVTVVLTDLAPALRPLLAAAGLDGDAEASVRELPDVDHAVQWCEDRLLEERSAPAGHRGDAAEAWDPATTGFDLAVLDPFLERRVVPAGRVLVRQGEASDDMFFLASGQLTAQVERDDGETVRLRTIRPGSVVGEVGMYLGTARIAAVVADRPSTVCLLSRQALAELERQRPDVAAELHAWLARLLARRVSDDVRSLTALLR